MAGSGIYNRLKANLMKGLVNLHTGGDTIKVALYNVTHDFTATDTDYTTDNEISGSGYDAGGKTLQNQAVTEAATTDWDADDLAWADATFSAWSAVIYDSTVSNDLIATIDFGGEKAVASGTFTIQFDSSGIITLA